MGFDFDAEGVQDGLDVLAGDVQHPQVALRKLVDLPVRERLDEPCAGDAVRPVEVAPAKIAAKPEPKSGETVGALPVKAYEGLYYQAAWGSELSGLTTGEKVKATGPSLYLGVIKQTGEKGFYKLTVSEK